MAVISGKDGTVSFGSSVTDATGWSLSLTSNNPAYGSSDTSGYKKRVAGVKDWSGSYSGKLNGTTVPTLGASVTVSFSTDGTTAWSGTAVCDAVNIEVDMDDGDVVGYSVDFSGNSVVTAA